MKLRASCLCGAVRYTATGPFTDLHGCHCSQCRKQSGHFVAAANAPREGVIIEGEENLTWFEATPGIRRGFCRFCGSHMIWDKSGDPLLSLNAGAWEAPTGLRLEAHIFVADKGDYYVITDGLPQHAAYPEQD